MNTIGYQDYGEELEKKETRKTNRKRRQIYKQRINYLGLGYRIPPKTPKKEWDLAKDILPKWK